MLASDRLAPPVGYSGWWTVLAVALLAVVALGLATLVVVTRTRTPRATRAEVASARAHALAGIDAVAGNRTLSTREAYLRLSGIVRDYVASTRPGWPRRATAMTLTDLDAARTDRGSEALADFVRSCYPVEFEPDSVGDPTAAVAAARRLVTTWT